MGRLSPVGMSRTLRRVMSALALLAFALPSSPAASCAELDPCCVPGIAAAHGEEPADAGPHPARSDDGGRCDPFAAGATCGTGCAGACVIEARAPYACDTGGVVATDTQESALPRAAIPPEPPPPRR